jgi:hypothetical protein
LLALVNLSILAGAELDLVLGKQPGAKVVVLYTGDRSEHGERRLAHNEWRHKPWMNL